MTMNPSLKTLAAATLTVAAVVCVTAFGLQRRSLDVLQEEKAAREMAKTTMVRSSPTIPSGQAPSDPTPGASSGAAPKSADAATATSTASRTDAPLTPDERIELMRLRSRVTDLKEKQRALAGIRKQHEDLRAKLTSASNYARGTLPAGYVRRMEAKNLGNTTPEGTIETFLWALQSRNIQVLTSLMPEAERQQFEAQIAKSGPDAFFNDAPAFPGFAIRSREDQGPDHVTLNLEMGPKNPWKVKLQRQNGAWSIEDM
jgi:hypothetical protein